jgi:AraC-like DNA-binding protein
MEIRRVHVSPDVDEFVESILLHSPEPDRDEQHLGLPGASAQLLVRARTPSASDYEIYVTGVRTRAKRKPAGTATALTVRFRLGAARQILGVPLDELADSVVTIDQLWSNDGDRLRRSLAGVADVEGRVRLLERAIRSRAARRGGQNVATTDLVRRAAQSVQAPRKLPSVGELARTLNIGERRLRRAFRDAAGIGPKTYLRTLRLRRAVVLAPKRPWSAVAVEAGYYDQAHMIDEFQQLVGTTPASFVDEMLKVRGRSVRAFQPDSTDRQSFR